MAIVGQGTVARFRNRFRNSGNPETGQPEGRISLA